MRKLIVVVVLAIAGFVAYREMTRAWHVYSSAKGNYSVEMPGMHFLPETRTISQGPFSAKLVAVQGESERVAYTAAYIDFPVMSGMRSQPDANELLRAAVAGGVQAVKAKVVNEEEMTVRGMPAREVVADLPNATHILRGRFALSGRRVYMLLIVAAKENREADEVNRFFDSFQLTGT